MNSRRSKGIPTEYLDSIFSTVGQKLTEGFSSEAEKILLNTINSYEHTPDDDANLKRLLSFTLETLGRYKDAFDVIEPFENETALKSLKLETQLKVTTQLGISYSNQTDHPKAATLLKRALRQAQENDLKKILGDIYIALARVYRKLNEFSISRDQAEKALNHFREVGNWRGMAESYQAIAAAHYQQGHSEKSLEFFQLAVQIIGERGAPFMLGKIYSDMSGAYYQLHRPQDGIACLEKSIEFFDRTEHKLNSVIAYNNLGMNLMVLGDWARAEKMMLRALDLATEVNHVHVAGILDSIAELKLLRGKYDEAKELLERSIAFAHERKKEWYALHAMRNLARCLLAQGEIAAAVSKAYETIELGKTLGENQTVNTSSLVLAECFLMQNDFDRCEDMLRHIESAAPPSDFYLLGSVQRIRGLAASQIKDAELAVHHFSRSLTIFEASEDLYHIALINFLLGKSLAADNGERAAAHFSKAAESFARLGIGFLADEARAHLAEIRNRKVEKTAKPLRRQPSAVSPLLTVRLAEATASRELLFRELVAVLQQESRAKKIIVAEMNDDKMLYPSITHNSAAGESAGLIEKLNEAYLKNDLKNFARVRNAGVFHLRPSSAPPAFLIISPQSGAVLNDESAIQPLLRVVELGMDVIALREKDKSQTTEQEANPFTSQTLMPGFIHSSPAMTSLVEEVYKIRSSDVTVLVTGESGTGKELVSRAIHTISNRKDKVFVPFNCTAVPKELAEGHLFGYRKGAFTGAVTDSPGIIRAADGGTLFLDEVGDLPIDVQPKLLRFLQEGEVQPIGEKRPIKVDVRVIAATNMPLEQKVADGSFREDLYYRLNVIRLRVPPLRERRSEIPPMINYYINHYSSRFGKRQLTVTPQTIDLLMVSEWDGNVRQLCNEIQRVVARAEDGEIITPEHLSPELKRAARPLTHLPENGNVKSFAANARVAPNGYRGSQAGNYATNQSNGFPNNYAGNAPFGGNFAPYSVPDIYDVAEIGARGGTLETAVAELETLMIRDSLGKHDWNISRVARELGLTRRGLYMKIARYGIEKAA